MHKLREKSTHPFRFVFRETLHALLHAIYKHKKGEGEKKKKNPGVAESLPANTQ